MSDRKPDQTKANRTAPPPKKTATNSKKQFDREAEEALLMKKYPSQNIVRGSLRNSGEVAEFGNKRTIEIVCQGDKRTKRRIATSDLHQVKYSREYLKTLRQDKAKVKGEAKTKKNKAGRKKKTPQTVGAE